MTSAEKIRAALKEGKVLSAGRAAQISDTDKPWATTVLQAMHKKGLAHIAKWDRSYRGKPVAHYAAGPGADAPRPTPYSNAEKCARYQDRKKRAA